MFRYIKSQNSVNLFANTQPLNSLKYKQDLSTQFSVIPQGLQRYLHFQLNTLNNYKTYTPL